MKATHATYYPNKRGLDEAAGISMERVAAEIARDTYANLVKMKAWDTGNLARSYRHEKNGIWWVVGSNVEYAPFIEYGTYKMAARPALQQACNAAVRRYGGKTSVRGRGY